jgi:hypothetical protein
MKTSRSQPSGAPKSAATEAAPSAAARPAYVTEALRGLTRTQKKFVLAGCLHGDFTMATVRALRSKALFYLHIDSPNGRCGFMKLTPLGETVREILKAEGRSDG